MDATDHVPTIKERANSEVMTWIPAIVFTGAANSFDTIVDELHKTLAQACDGRGRVGVAGGFKAKTGEKAKCRCVIPYRGRDSVVCDFLVLRTGQDVTISFGKGVHTRFYLLERLAFNPLPMAAMLIGGVWIWMHTGYHPESQQLVRRLIAIGLFALMISYFFVILRREKLFREDEALRSSATETIGVTFFRLAQEWKRSGY